MNARYLQWLAIVLVGYAAFGRAFSYLGLAPVYMGELITVAAALLLFIRFADTVSLFNQPLTWLLAAFMTLCAVRTVPYVEVYGLAALRDAAIWGYATVGLATAVVFSRSGTLRQAIRWYTTFAKIMPLWFLGVALCQFLTGGAIPHCPWASSVPLLGLKAGDIAVHLSGILAFSVLIAPKHSFSKTWQVIWYLAFISSCTVQRASMVTLAAVLLVLMLNSRITRWFSVLAIGCGIAYLTVITGMEIKVGGKVFSAKSFYQETQSIVADDPKSPRSDSKEWRLRWWNKIISYTIYGPYFWKGKGFGINLADADGFQVSQDGSLRSPHNSHLTILARTGVPGFALWSLLQLCFALTLWLCHMRHKACGNLPTANLYLWLLLYWLAFTVNASFDVVYEGPHSGIWYWSLFGASLALLNHERRSRRLSQRASLQHPQKRYPVPLAVS